MKYFAYGSNCSVAIMRRKGVEYTSRQRAVLRGFRLKFNKKSLRKHLPDSIGYANINFDSKAIVEGILYDIVDEHRTMLDESERYPEHYDRILVKVETENATYECSAYQAQSDKTADGLVPSRDYLDHILAARDIFSEPYFEALESSPTYLGDCTRCRAEGEVLFLKELDQVLTLCQRCREARINSQKHATREA